jgi:hypothetical protein
MLFMRLSVDFIKAVSATWFDFLWVNELAIYVRSLTAVAAMKAASFIGALLASIRELNSVRAYGHQSVSGK